VSLIGIGIGPEDPVVYELTGDGKLPTELGGVQVFFGQTPAHLLLASENRINAIAPADFVEESKVSVTVVYQGETTNAVTVRVVPSNPAAFFLKPAQAVPPFDESILNANGGLNRSPDPAIRGEIIQIFLAGGGTLDPAQEAGSITPVTPPYPRFAVPVRVFLAENGDVPPEYELEVVYAGAAPGQPAGGIQINARIPPDLRFPEISLHPGAIITASWNLIIEINGLRRPAIGMNLPDVSVINRP
jgi:uncharacterized protein (TIGR03437 family)